MFTAVLQTAVTADTEVSCTHLYNSIRIQKAYPDSSGEVLKPPIFSQLLFPALSRNYIVQSLPLHFFKIHFFLLLPSISRSSKRTLCLRISCQKSVRISLPHDTPFPRLSTRHFVAGKQLVGINIEDGAFKLFKCTFPGFNLQAPCALYIGTGVSLLSRERFLYI